MNTIKRCLLTVNPRSMSIDCRSRMEIEATEEVVRLFTNKTLENEVPQDEYDLQKQGL